MNSSDDLAVTVVPRPTQQLVAVLNEIDTLIQQYIHSGQEGNIDLRSLPLFPGDYDMLKQLLGEGEVTATLQAMGPSTITETRIPGVWWLSHYNDDNEKIAEYIEVTRCPLLLKTADQDLVQASDKLKELIESVVNE